MTTWSLDILDMAGAAVKTNAPFTLCVPTWVRNEPGALTATFPLSAVSFADLNPDNGREVKLKRGATTIWGGYLTGCQFDTRGERKVRIQVDGYLSVLDWLYLQADLQYNAVAQETIAWGLINAAQGLADAAYGFTQGVHVGPSVTRTRTYCAEERPNVGEEIARFSELSDGIDYEINPATKKLNTWSPRRGSASGVTIGPKMMQADVTIDLADVANYVDAIGSEDCGPAIQSAIDHTAGARVGRRGAVVGDSGTSDPGEVLTAATEYLRAHKDGRWTAKVAYSEAKGPAWGTYDLGDSVTLSSADNFATFSKLLRLVERTMTIQMPSDTGVFIEETFESAAL